MCLEIDMLQEKKEKKEQSRYVLKSIVVEGSIRQKRCFINYEKKMGYFLTIDKDGIGAVVFL